MISVIVVGGVAAGVAGISVVLLTIRKLVSRKWGYFRSDVRLDGKVVILTGGNTGLGLEVAKDLAGRGATLVLACRNWERTRPVIADLRKKYNNNDIQFIKLDLGSLESVGEFANEFLAKYSRLDTLICNAGVWVEMDREMKTPDGLEIHAGTNHLGHFHLTNLLLDRLKATAGSRVVVVSSMLMARSKLDFDVYDHFHTGRRLEVKTKRDFAPTGYCDSKMMNAVFARSLATRLGGSSPVCVSVCPGWCYTELARHVNIPMYKRLLFLPIVVMFMRSAWRGAHNILHAALEQPDRLTTGGFYRECRLHVEADKQLNEVVERAGETLWSTSERLCEKKN